MALEIDINDLTFHEFVGGGAYGSVYRGEWISRQQVVAIKRHTAADSPTEVAILSKLSHRNIIQLYGAVTVPPNLCFVTEYASMGSLYHYLQGSNLDFPQIKTWARQIARGMNYLHNEAPLPVIHRDLKSKNVVLSEDMTAKICDFGCASFMKNTTKMSLAGTFPWMAPEAIQQLPLDRKSDTFSYGVVVWELLTSEIPFKGLEGVQVAWLVVHHKQRLTIPSSCPPPIAQLMRSCWLETPKDRPDFQQILGALQAMAEDTTLPDATQTFLNLRDEWKAEIEATLNKLKTLESGLNAREVKLQQKEAELARREHDLKFRHHKAPASADVAGWSEENVAQWIRYLAAESGRDDLGAYADVFVRNNINGQRLLQLGAEELTQMVHSFGPKMDMLNAIIQLQDRNNHLQEYPPLGAQPELARRQSSEGARPPQSIELSVIFGNHFHKSIPPNPHKWKMYMEFDGPDSAILCIKCVKFKFSEEDIIRINQPPFLMDRWRHAEDHTQTVECLLEYDSRVKQPRRLVHQHTLDFTSGTDCAQSKQYDVTLTLKRRAGSTCAEPTGHYDSSRGACSAASGGFSQPDSGVYNGSGPPSLAGSITSSERQPRFDIYPSVNPRKAQWPVVKGGGSPSERPPNLHSVSSSASPSTSLHLGVSPISLPPSGNAWFSGDRLSWPTGEQPRNSFATGPRIAPAPSARHQHQVVARSSSDNARVSPTSLSRARPGAGRVHPQMQKQASSPALRGTSGGAAVAGGVTSSNAQRQQHYQHQYHGGGASSNRSAASAAQASGSGGGGWRPLGDSKTMPTGRGQAIAENSTQQPYRRSVSDIARGTGRPRTGIDGGQPVSQQQPQNPSSVQPRQQQQQQQPNRRRQGMQVDTTRQPRSQGHASGGNPGGGSSSGADRGGGYARRGSRGNK